MPSLVPACSLPKLSGVRRILGGHALPRRTTPLLLRTPDNPISQNDKSFLKKWDSLPTLMTNSRLTAEGTSYIWFSFRLRSSCSGFNFFAP